MKIDDAQVKALLHNLSHDLKGSLGTSAGLLAMLSEKYADGLDPTAQKWLGLVAKEYAVTQAKLSGLSSYTQLLNYDAVLTLCDLGSIVQQAVTKFAQNITLGEEEDAVQVSVEQHCSAKLMVDTHLLHLYIYELLLNSSLHASNKASEREADGSLPSTDVRCRITSQKTENCVSIVFEDNGELLLESDLSYIQAPFRMLKGKSRSLKPRAGMGLSKLQLIAGLLGGTLSYSIGAPPYSGLCVRLDIHNTQA